jgi:hypothetical protein
MECHRAFALWYSLLWKVRSYLAFSRPEGQSPPLVSFKSIPEVRGLSSTGITRHQRSHGPLHSRPNQHRKALLRVATPRQGRASHGTQATFLTCCPHYPGRSDWVQMTVASPSHIGLPRILGESASTTVLSGPAQGSRVLRPARSLQPYGLQFSPKLQQGGLPIPLSG